MYDNKKLELLTKTIQVSSISESVDQTGIFSVRGGFTFSKTGKEMNAVFILVYDQTEYKNYLDKSVEHSLKICQLP